MATLGMSHVNFEDTETEDEAAPPATSRWRPSAWRVHGALILAQVIFGAAAVVGKLGVEKFNPLLFALIREGVAGPLLLFLAIWRDGCLIPREGDWKLVPAMGFCVFANQAFSILGIKLAGPVISSAWQCSQPIFTLSISLALGWEAPTWRKMIGILLSFLSGAFLVTYGHATGDAGAMGNIFLALNCLGTSLYVIYAKLALQRYPALTVTAWAMMAASLMMAVLAGILNNNCEVIRFVCPPVGENDFTCEDLETSCLPWHVPPGALLPLMYFVLGNSIGAYLLITWANRYARAGYVLAYTALQPFTSTLLSVLLIVAGVQGLEMPGWNALGGLGILLALLLLILDGRAQHQADEADRSFERKAPRRSPKCALKVGTLSAYDCNSHSS